MRYSITGPTGPSLEDIRKKINQVAGTDVKVSPLTRQVFCELSDQQVAELRLLGLEPKPIRKVKPCVVTSIVVSAEIMPGVELAPLRNAFTPALTGAGLTVAVLDSGVRKTHNELIDKVIYEANFSGAASATDVFNHGTQVASIIAGLECGVSPGAALMNIKILNDEGEGSDETVIDGIEEVCRLANEAKAKSIHFTEPEYPNVINLSIGREDDDDSDSPIKVASRIASEEYGVEVIAAAGNGGPRLSSILAPASEPTVIAIGGVESQILQLWERSSRGPTLCGETKPDFVSWATGILGASAEGDNVYITKDGTSFATPIISGMRGLLDEMVMRRYGREFILPWSVIREIAPAVCVKPEDTPLGKDNSWGYGVPIFSLVAQGITQPTIDISSVTGLMGVVMLGMMMVGMFR